MESIESPFTGIASSEADVPFCDEIPWFFSFGPAAGVCDAGSWVGCDDLQDGAVAEHTGSLEPRPQSRVRQRLV